MGKLGRVISVAAVMIIVIGGIIFLNNNQTKAPSDQPEQNSQTGNENTEAAAVITYDGNGFSLSTNTVKSGDTVRVDNKSDKDLDFNSDPHPVHTDNKELNAGDITPGASKSFVLTLKGTWGFHNHLNSSQNGELTVE